MVTRTARARQIAGRIALGGAVVCALLVAFVLFANTPTAIVRRLAAGNASWLLSDYMERPTGIPAAVRNGGRKMLAAYIQYGMASSFRARHPISDTGTDAERLFAELIALRRTMLNQNEVHHDPAQWAPLLSGVGYCDQMNAMAANVLGGVFKHAQIVAIADPVSHAGHTVGRVWSASNQDWLYFDLWDQVVVFRLDKTGRPVILAERDPFPRTVDVQTSTAIRHLYDFAGAGIVFNEYPSSFGGFLLQRSGRAMRRKTLDSFAPAAAIPVKASATSASTPSVPREVSTRIRRAYIEARLTHLFDGAERARPEYARLAAVEPTSTLGQASAIFAQRLGATQSALPGK